MPQSFACLDCHIVFATKGRHHWLDAAITDRLYGYLGGMLRAEHCPLVAIGGMTDHVHLLVSLTRETSVAELLRVVKAGSSKWIHDTFPAMAGFAWQAGYGAFAVSHSNVEAVTSYIAGQAEHHRVRSFQEEYVLLLQKHGIEFDPRYLWD